MNTWLYVIHFFRHQPDWQNEKMRAKNLFSLHRCYQFPWFHNKKKKLKHQKLCLCHWHLTVAQITFNENNRDETYVRATMRLTFISRKNFINPFAIGATLKSGMETKRFPASLSHWWSVVLVDFNTFCSSIIFGDSRKSLDFLFAIHILKVNLKKKHWFLCFIPV